MRSVLKFGTERGEILVSDPLLLPEVGVTLEGEDISPDTLTSRSRLSNSCDDLGRIGTNAELFFHFNLRESYFALLGFLTEQGLPSLAMVVLRDSVDSLLNME